MLCIVYGVIVVLVVVRTMDRVAVREFVESFKVAEE